MYVCMYVCVLGCPSIVRADRGTENTTVAFIQPALRHYHMDSLAKEKSFLYGRSTANQVSFILKCKSYAILLIEN